MAESCAAAPEEAAAKSPLDKPLHQLTEDDIAQVTREDCRRYLKEKGSDVLERKWYNRGGILCAYAFCVLFVWAQE